MRLQNISFVYYVTAASFATSCGSKSDSNDGLSPLQASDLAADSQLTAGVVNVSHGDAVAAAADQVASAARLRISDNDRNDSGLDNDGDDDTSTVTKSCAASSDGLSAIITTTSTINRARTKTSNGGRVTVTSTRTGSGASTRTWSRSDGTAVVCKSDRTGAQADFKNPSGLRLEISFERSRTDSKSYTGPKLTRSSSKSMTSAGKRTVTWSSNDASGDSNTTYTRNKTVVIKDTTNSITLSNKDGQKLSTTLTVNTAAEAPLVVKVERNTTSHAVVSKTFVSGQVVVTKDSDATITTTYNNLKLDFSDNSCSIMSGSAQIAITDSNGATIKTLSLAKNADGDNSLSDDSGSEIEGFSLDECDSEDIKL